MSFVKRLFQKISILNLHAVLKNVDVSCHGQKVKGIKRLGLADVYCLTVPETGNFIANGIVIKNCDAMRYALYTHFFGKDKSSRRPEDIDRDYMEAMGRGPELPGPFNQVSPYF